MCRIVVDLHVLACSLYCRRVKSDLIMSYKVLHIMFSIDYNALIQCSQVSHTRRNKTASS